MSLASLRPRDPSSMLVGIVVTWTIWLAIAAILPGCHFWRREGHSVPDPVTAQFSPSEAAVCGPARLVDIEVRDVSSGVNEATLRQLGLALAHAVPLSGIQVGQVAISSVPMKSDCEEAACVLIKPPIPVTTYQAAELAGQVADSSSVTRLKLTVAIVEYRAYIPQQLVARLQVVDEQSGMVIATTVGRWQGESLSTTERLPPRPFFRRAWPAATLTRDQELSRISSEVFLRQAARDMAQWVLLEGAVPAPFEILPGSESPPSSNASATVIGPMPMEVAPSLPLRSPDSDMLIAPIPSTLPESGPSP